MIRCEKWMVSQLVHSCNSAEAVVMSGEVDCCV